MIKPRPILLLAAAAALTSGSARAVIVGGANGDGLGNATESGLQSFLATESLPAFSYWSNLLRVSDSSGIYLGIGESNGRGWVMTATHVTPLTVGTSTITVAGQAYVVRGSQVITHTDLSGTYSTDIRLYAIGGNVGDPALPTLSAVQLLSGNVDLGDSVLMTGRGRRLQGPPEDTTAPYSWDMGFDEANQITRQMRWGSNIVDYNGFYLDEGSPTPTKRTVCFATDFDDPTAGGTGYEGQLALLDSGGGAFVLRGGAWWLAGTGYTVDDGPDADTAINPAGYGDYSIMTHLPTYRSQILSITGNLVPEPSAGILVVGSFVGLIFRRRR